MVGAPESILSLVGFGLKPGPAPPEATPRRVRKILIIAKKNMLQRPL
jgi:hypothetical protein